MTYPAQPVSAMYHSIIGISSSMQQVRTEVRKAAKYHYKVLILGPSGSGKELVARQIHGLSSRSKEPFVAINSCAIPEHLAESFFFGHRKGAFTDAKEQKGKFEDADGGTLMIDEIGDMPLDLQLMLFRALNDSMIVRLGDSVEKMVDVRLITATNQDPKELIRQGRFREELYYRIKEGVIFIPGLRDRREDIRPLVAHYLPLICRNTGLPLRQLEDAAFDILMDHDWPGNIRELQNCITRSLLYDMENTGTISKDAIVYALAN